MKIYSTNSNKKIEMSQKLINLLAYLFLTMIQYHYLNLLIKLGLFDPDKHISIIFFDKKSKDTYRAKLDDNFVKMHKLHSKHVLWQLLNVLFEELAEYSKHDEIFITVVKFNVIVKVVSENWLNYKFGFDAKIIEPQEAPVVHQSFFSQLISIIL